MSRTLKHEVEGIWQRKDEREYLPSRVVALRPLVFKTMTVFRSRKGISCHWAARRGAMKRPAQKRPAAKGRPAREASHGILPAGADRSLEAFRGAVQEALGGSAGEGQAIGACC